MDNNLSIPRIVHRTVPKVRTELMEKCWESVLEHTPGWTHMTHEDDDEYRLIGPYLHLCKEGAFRADLIRLEVLYRYGGVYLDSDVELFRSIDPLLANEMFLVAEEDTSGKKHRLYLMNAVMGTVPNNQIILEMINLSVSILVNDGMTTTRPYFVKDAVRRDAVPFVFGPYVIDRIGMKYKTITKLSAKSFNTFYPVKNQDTSTLKNDTEVYGSHRYAGSWLEGLA